MINYNKNKLINETLTKYYNTFSHTLDTADFVPEKYNEKICRYIFKNLKKTFKRINKVDRKYQRAIKQKERKERWKKFWTKWKSKKQKPKRSKISERKNADSNNNS